MAYYNRYQNQGDINTAEGDVSKINAAGLINFRIQGWWTRAGELFTSAQFDQARDILDMLWAEFYADASPEQVKEMEGLNNVIRLNIYKRNKETKNKKMWHQFHGIYVRTVFNKLLFLKTVEKKQGVGKAYIDKDADDFD